MKTDDIVERLRELLSNATPAQWFIVPYGDGDSLVVHSDDEKRVFFPPVPVGYSASPGSTGDPAQIKADVELIVAARNCLPALLDEIERLRSSPDRAAIVEATGVLVERAINDTTSLIVASCTCLTKTPDPAFHNEDCRYRRLESVLSSLQAIRSLSSPAKGADGTPSLGGSHD